MTPSLIYSPKNGNYRGHSVLRFDFYTFNFGWNMFYACFTNIMGLHLNVKPCKMQIMKLHQKLIKERRQFVKSIFSAIDGRVIWKLRTLMPIFHEQKIRKESRDLGLYALARILAKSWHKVKTLRKKDTLPDTRLFRIEGLNKSTGEQ